MAGNDVGVPGSLYGLSRSDNMSLATRPMDGPVGYNPPSMLKAFGLTDVGRARKTNEDLMFFDLDLGLFVVADGMGGHSAGEVASQLAVGAIRDFLMQARSDNQFTWPFG